MRGVLILLVFFSMFTCASLLIPSPMFPGVLLYAMIEGIISGYGGLLSSIFNGVFYGTILWLVFVVISKRLEK